MERRNRHGVYFVFTSMEMGSTFRSQMPKFPTESRTAGSSAAARHGSCITTSTSAIRERYYATE
jgi:hypothetical protein